MFFAEIVDLTQPTVFCCGGPVGQQVGDVVASCDFDNSVVNNGLLVGCDGVGYSPAYGNFYFYLASSSDSADTGPAADHTGNGDEYHDELCCVVIY